MLNRYLLQNDVQEFIQKNLKSDLSKLILKGSPFKNVSIQELAIQIETKRKAEKKIPTWFTAEEIIYPKSLNLEQTSSETTARYKAGLVEGESLIDLTGGFGIDSYFFAEKFNKTIHCEINTALSEIAAHNFQQLNNRNTEFYQGSGIDFLKQNNQIFDWSYIDPSRRDEDGSKVFRLADCEPDILSHLDLLLKHSKNGILMKTSPLLDLSLGLEELNHRVSKIEIVAVNNEVKELLWFIPPEENLGDLPIKTINFTNTGSSQVFEANFHKEQVAEAGFSKPLAYLYEPNSAILKSGFFNSLAEKLNIFKLAAHSHLYTSAEKIEFPGRSFKVKQTLAFQKKNFKKLGITKANITTRNFPMSVEEIRKKLKIKDGGNDYLFFTTNAENEKLVVICEKIS